MLHQGKDIQLTAQTELPFWDAPFEKRPYFMQTYDAAREGQWERLKTITALWLKSEPQSSEAIFSNGIAYFELKDFIPHIIKLCKEYKVATIFNASGILAKITVVNAEAPDEQIIFESDLVHSEIQSAQKIQCLGGTHTYMRRYLLKIT